MPPKRVGVLQSAVNMRLLARAATNSKKRLVIITNNTALSGLAAAAAIPVAKNLQSKPELAEIPALEIDDGNDIIDGEQLPVGEHAKTAPASSEEATKSAGLAAAIASVRGASDDKPVRAAPPAPGQALPKPKAKKGSKVPNFNTFRKKLFIFGGLGLLFIVFLVWAIWFAPRATVVISAQTTAANVDRGVTLTASGATNYDEDSLRIVEAKEEDTLSVEFEATGEKEVGERATGTMTITRDRASRQSSTIPAGTGFSSGDYTFVTTESVVVPRSDIDFEASRIENGSASVDVRATEIGPSYNLNARSYESSIDGFSARGSDMTGGSKKTVTVVSQSDIDRAAQQLEDRKDDSMKQKLKDQLGDGIVIIEESYVEKRSNTESKPGLDKQAEKATLTSKVTYTLLGIEKDQLDKYLDEAVGSQIGSQHDQQVYSNGSDDVVFSEFTQNDDSYSVQLVTTGQTGPKIDETEIKKQVAGQRYGEVQSQLESIEGVSDVDVKFWPFWVKTVPENIDKITIEFKLSDDS